jgi:hypothetical protein
MKSMSVTSLVAAALLAPGLCPPLSAQEFAERRTPAVPEALPVMQLEKLPAEPSPAVERDVRFQRPMVTNPTALAKTPPRPDAKHLPSFDRHHVYFTLEADGTQWARGETYKARFGADGASYAPYLGVNAPRNFPVKLRIASVSVGGVAQTFDANAPAQRDGNVVRYERGGLSEIYELAPDSIEQKFVLATRPDAQGDLVLRLSAESELEKRELSERSGPAAACIEFANELGAVRYGRATAVDAAGHSAPAQTTTTAEGIQIRVASEFVESASFPLTIDPIVSTFSIDTNLPDAFLPDCTYDYTNQCWLVVHEEIFSASDHDVVWRRIGLLNAASLGSGYVDYALGDYWANPACANNNALDKFCIVAQVGIPGSGPRKIYARIMSASDGAMGVSLLNIGAEDPFVDLTNPDVGGDPLGLPSYFCVVWEKDNGPTDHDIYYRMVDPGNTLASPIRIVDISGATVDTNPSISKSDDGTAWNVVWQRQSTSMPYQQDIRGARINWAGNTIASSFPIDSSITNTPNPKATTNLNGTSRWAVAYQYDFGSDWDVNMTLLDGSTVTDTASVTGMEVLAGNLPTLLENQVQPDIDTDGNSFAVTYSESYQGSSYNYDVYVATVAAVGNQLQLSEGHRQIAASTTPERNPSIASADGSGLAWRVELIVLDDASTSSSHGNIEGGLYDNGLFTSFCHPTFDGVAACPCGNNPSAYGYGCNNSANTGGAQLVAAGTASIGSDDMLLISQFTNANALVIFNQGNVTLASSVPFGQGLRCVGGSLKRLYAKTASTGIAFAPGASDPSIHARSAALGDPISAGQTRSYYAYYRDPIVLGGCSSALTYNTTQAVQAIWIP